MDRVRSQYECHPYPPVPWMALPRRGEGAGLIPASGLTPRRILVVGCGTLEPVVAAQVFAGAERVVAVDVSAASIAAARKRSRFARLTRKLAPIELVRADFLDWAPKRERAAAGAGLFHLVIASNVLHHLEDPAAALAACSRLLAPGGYVRLTTYPRHSRHFMRETARYFRSRGIGAEERRLVGACRAAIGELGDHDPRRSCFESHPETRRHASLIDAFFHVRENPLRPLEWREAARASGLELEREDQDPGSRSGWLAEIAPATARLDAWTRLEVLDLLLELCANPVLWLKKVSDTFFPPPVSNLPHFSLQSAVIEAARLLAAADVQLAEVIQAIARESGPRMSAPPESRPLPGLSILDHLSDLELPKT